MNRLNGSTMHFEHCVILLLIINSMLSECLPTQRRYRFCGNNLADALHAACYMTGGGYNVPSWDNPAQGMKARRRDNPGVSTECCRHGCTWRTLLSYCQGSVKLRDMSDVEVNNFGELIVKSMKGSASRPKMLAAAAPEVGITKKHEGRKGRKGNKGRKGRTQKMCMTEKRPKPTRKVDIENVKRSAPVFGTVSPEYLRLPRTLDQVPAAFYGIQ